MKKTLFIVLAVAIIFGFIACNHETPVIDVAGINIEKEYIHVTKAEEAVGLKVGASVYPANATNTALRYKSDNPAVVVDQNGNITLTSGYQPTSHILATIEVRSVMNPYAVRYCYVAVNHEIPEESKINITGIHSDAPGTSISLATPVDMFNDDTCQIVISLDTQYDMTNNYKDLFDFTSSKPEVATVDENGLVSVVKDKAGEVTITVTSKVPYMYISGYPVYSSASFVAYVNPIKDLEDFKEFLENANSPEVFLPCDLIIDNPQDLPQSLDLTGKNVDLNGYRIIYNPPVTKMAQSKSLSWVPMTVDATHPAKALIVVDEDTTISNGEVIVYADANYNTVFYVKGNLTLNGGTFSIYSTDSCSAVTGIEVAEDASLTMSNASVVVDNTVTTCSADAYGIKSSAASLVLKDAENIGNKITVNATKTAYGISGKAITTQDAIISVSGDSSVGIENTGVASLTATTVTAKAVDGTARIVDAEAEVIVSGGNFEASSTNGNAIAFAKKSLLSLDDYLESKITFKNKPTVSVVANKGFANVVSSKNAVIANNGTFSATGKSAYVFNLKNNIKPSEIVVDSATATGFEAYAIYADFAGFIEKIGGTFIAQGTEDAEHTKATAVYLKDTFLRAVDDVNTPVPSNGILANTQIVAKADKAKGLFISLNDATVTFPLTIKGMPAIGVNINTGVNINVDAESEAYGVVFYNAQKNAFNDNFKIDWFDENTSVIAKANIGESYALVNNGQLSFHNDTEGKVVSGLFKAYVTQGISYGLINGNYSDEEIKNRQFAPEKQGIINVVGKAILNFVADSDFDYKYNKLYNVPGKFFAFSSNGNPISLDESLGLSNAASTASCEVLTYTQVDAKDIVEIKMHLDATEGNCINYLIPKNTTWAQFVNNSMLSWNKYKVEVAYVSNKATEHIVLGETGLLGEKYFVADAKGDAVLKNKVIEAGEYYIANPVTITTTEGSKTYYVDRGATWSRFVDRFADQFVLNGLKVGYKTEEGNDIYNVCSLDYLSILELDFDDFATYVSALEPIPYNKEFKLAFNFKIRPTIANIEFEEVSILQGTTWKRYALTREAYNLLSTGKNFIAGGYYVGDADRNAVSEDDLIKPNASYYLAIKFDLSSIKNKVKSTTTYYMEYGSSWTNFINQYNTEFENDTMLNLDTPIATVAVGVNELDSYQKLHIGEIKTLSDVQAKLVSALVPIENNGKYSVVMSFKEYQGLGASYEVINVLQETAWKDFAKDSLLDQYNVTAEYVDNYYVYKTNADDLLNGLYVTTDKGRTPVNKEDYIAAGGDYYLSVRFTLPTIGEAVETAQDYFVKNGTTWYEFVNTLEPNKFCFVEDPTNSSKNQVAFGTDNSTDSYRVGTLDKKNLLVDKHCIVTPVSAGSLLGANSETIKNNTDYKACLQFRMYDDVSDTTPTTYYVNQNTTWKEFADESEYHITSEVVDNHFVYSGTVEDGLYVAENKGRTAVDKDSYITSDADYYLSVRFTLPTIGEPVELAENYFVKAGTTWRTFVTEIEPNSFSLEGAVLENKHIIFGEDVGDRSYFVGTLDKVLGVDKHCVATPVTILDKDNDYKDTKILNNADYKACIKFIVDNNSGTNEQYVLQNSTWAEFLADQETSGNDVSHLFATLNQIFFGTGEGDSNMQSVTTKYGHEIVKPNDEIIPGEEYCYSIRFYIDNVSYDIPSNTTWKVFVDEYAVDKGLTGYQFDGDGRVTVGGSTLAATHIGTPKSGTSYSYDAATETTVIGNNSRYYSCIGFGFAELNLLKNIEYSYDFVLPNTTWAQYNSSDYIAENAADITKLVKSTDAIEAGKTYCKVVKFSFKENTEKEYYKIKGSTWKTMEDSSAAFSVDDNKVFFGTDKTLKDQFVGTSSDEIIVIPVKPTDTIESKVYYRAIEFKLTRIDLDIDNISVNNITNIKLKDFEYTTYYYVVPNTTWDQIWNNMTDGNTDASIATSDSDYSKIISSSSAVTAGGQYYKVIPFSISGTNMITLYGNIWGLYKSDSYSTIGTPKETGSIFVDAVLPLEYIRKKAYYESVTFRIYEKATDITPKYKSVIKGTTWSQFEDASSYSNLASDYDDPGHNLLLADYVMKNNTPYYEPISFTIVKSDTSYTFYAMEGNFWNKVVDNYDNLSSKSTIVYLNNAAVYKTSSYKWSEEQSTVKQVVAGHTYYAK